MSQVPQASTPAAPFVLPCPEGLCRLLAEGREQGYLDGTLLVAALHDVELGAELLEELLAACAEHGIEVLEGEAPTSTPLAAAMRPRRRSTSR